MLCSVGKQLLRDTPSVLNYNSSNIFKFKFNHPFYLKIYTNMVKFKSCLKNFYLLSKPHEKVVIFDINF